MHQGLPPKPAGPCHARPQTCIVQETANTAAPETLKDEGASAREAPPWSLQLPAMHCCMHVLLDMQYALLPWWVRVMT